MSDERLLRSILAVGAMHLTAASALAALFAGGEFYCKYRVPGSNPAVYAYKGPFYAYSKIALSNGPTNGGPFDVTYKGGPEPLRFFPNVTTPDSFLYQTWCVESEVAFVHSTVFGDGGTARAYWATVERRAYTGWNLPHGDPISDVTEWIYDRWRAGNPSNWALNDIKLSIWYAEQEPNGQKKAPYNAAITALYAGVDPKPANLRNAKWTWALNMWDGWAQVDIDNDGQKEWIADERQSQIIPIPAPGAVVLGALGLGLIGWAKRRIL